MELILEGNPIKMRSEADRQVCFRRAYNFRLHKKSASTLIAIGRNAFKIL